MSIRIRDVNGHKADLFYLLLLYTGKYDYLPDLLEVVGKETMLKLMDTFAGVTITFPSIDEIKKHVSEIEIFLSIEMASKQRRPSLVKDLADQNRITETTVRNIYDRASKVIHKDLEMEVTRVKRKRSL